MRELTIPGTGQPDENSAARYVFDNAAKRPGHPALQRLVGGQWLPVTSREFADDVIATAQGLIAAGLEAGDRLALMSRNRYEWTVLDFAALSVGVVVVPVYETSSSAQLEWILQDSEAIAIVVETGEHRALLDALQAPQLRHVWQLDSSGLDEIRALGSEVPAELVHKRLDATTPDEPASIIYTSGTTGRPKGCVITHSNVIHEVFEVTRALPNLFSADNTTLLFLPLAHVFGRAITFGAIANGTTLGHNSDLANLVEELGSFRPTFVLGVPRVFEKVRNGAEQRAVGEGKGRIFGIAERVAVRYSQALDQRGPSIGLRLAHRLFDRLVYGRLRAALGGRCESAISGGAPLGRRLGHFFRGIGVTVYEGYGLTETTAGVCVNTAGLLKIGTVGRPVPGNSARIAADGELELSGPIIFDRYWRNEEATAEAFTVEGAMRWLHTGDLAEIDHEGFISIIGRKKELIVTAAGKNVAPSASEDRIRAHWLVDQCLVVGDRRPYVAALITIDPEAWPNWVSRAKLASSTTIADQVDDPVLHAELQSVVDEANSSVSRAEAIKKFVVLPGNWTEAGGQLTPSLKLKRAVVLAEQAAVIDALYDGPVPD